RSHATSFIPGHAIPREVRSHLIAAFVRDFADELGAVAITDAGPERVARSGVFPPQPARSQSARRESARDPSRTMETRRDRTFHLSLRRQLCRHAALGGSGVSLSRRGEGASARAARRRYEVPHLCFSAAGPLAAISKA